MLPRRNRLSRSAFPTKGRRFSSEHFSVVLPAHASGYAVVVSKKTARLSVQRHRIKRKVMEALRGLELPPALVVYPKASVLFMRPVDIREELATMLSKTA